MLKKKTNAQNGKYINNENKQSEWIEILVE